MEEKRIKTGSDFSGVGAFDQAYKQAGNSICVGVLVELIKKLKL